MMGNEGPVMRNEEITYFLYIVSVLTLVFYSCEGVQIMLYVRA
jgi:hypothetical protein